MAIDRLDIVIQGSGPYGFRLAGGDGRPLTVTKLRRQSKACAAGLHEGDILLGIDGYECRTMSHSSAMALLENAVSSISLSVFRGPLDGLDNALDAASKSLRPLSPRSLPPPLLLPPPPAAALTSSGDLVIDQPSFLRQNWPQQHKPDSSADQHAGDVDGPPPAHEAPPPPPQPPSMPSRPIPPVAEPRVLDVCPPQPLPPPEAMLPTFRVKQFSGEAKQWTPHGSGGGTPSHQHAPAAPPPPPVQQQQQATPPSTGGQPIQVSHHVPETSRSHVWQPTETQVYVRSHAEVDLGPEPEPTSWPTPPLGRVVVRLDRVDGGPPEDVEVVPRWALPLRSEYDWREAYNWADSDEWELTEDGQYCIRKKKIFADSSFYDEPEHKYPTIEEQIRMARKVAQSLMSPGNEKARGQRMFLRRKETADHWTADALRRRPAGRRAGRTVHVAAELLESEPEQPYYNPAPWAPPGGTWAPPSARRSPPRAPASGFVSAASRAWMSKSAEALPSVGSKWQPPERQHMELPARPVPPKHGAGSGVQPQVAFALAKDMARAHDKGGRMFAKRRARAAVEETEMVPATEAVQAARSEVMQRIADSYAAAVSPPAPKHDAVDSGMEHQPSASRLIEMIERSRATSTGPVPTHPTSGGGRDTMIGTVSFTMTAKTQAGFRPVRFKAPIVVTAADIAVVEQQLQLEQHQEPLPPETEGISDF